ncbi:MAG TPA: SDR family oxidoreductase [Tepidisphaeraceae bacterium]|nr:SDR family oxidoreductase [Tepidisphaeraceae bacterium]
MDLSGRWALVTGASRGLGAAIAKRLAAAGAKLILTARDPAGLNQIAAELKGAKVIPADLADPAQVERLLDACDGVEIIINNAGVQGPIGPFTSADFNAWQAVFQINFFAPARICQRLIEPMKKIGRGKIVNVSGGGATSPRPDFSAYGAAKCALVRLTETLAQELAGTGIDVNCMAPGAMNTQMLEQLLAAGPAAASREYAKALKQKQSGGASPESAAELAAFLASPASDGITGRLLSAVWDNWAVLPARREDLRNSDIYTLRRIVPADRGRKW